MNDLDERRQEKESSESFPNIIRYFIILACLLLYILIQSPLFTQYYALDLQIFRLCNDIIGNLLLAFAIILIVKPTQKKFICAMILGLISVGMDALLEMVINPLFGWYKPGGGAGTIVPTLGDYNIPYEMLIGFFAMGIVVATFTEFPRVFRTSWIRKVPGIKHIFSEGLFKNPKYDRLFVYLSSILLALFGAFGDLGTMSYEAKPLEYGPLLAFEPGWTIWHTFLIWQISLLIGITLYFYILDKFHNRKFSIFPAPIEK
ncbi:MAG: hypothetical protein HWN65_19385 [Candidatus Helarchaeota archaeon]|nr:hypothetical protein [Candidatus Helarchaeota archaeon]